MPHRRRQAGMRRPGPPKTPPGYRILTVATVLVSALSILANIVQMATSIASLPPWLLVALAVVSIVTALVCANLLPARRHLLAVVAVVIAVMAASAVWVAITSAPMAETPEGTYPTPPTPPVAGVPARPPHLAAAVNATAGRELGLTIGRPRPAVIGDVMVAQVVVRGPDAITPPAGWARRGSAVVHNENMEAFTKVVDADDLGTDSPYFFATVGDDRGEAGGIALWSGVDPAKLASAIPNSDPRRGSTATVGGVDIPPPGAVEMLMFSPVVAATSTTPEGMTPVWDVQTPDSPPPSPYLYRAAASCSWTESGEGRSPSRVVHIATDEAPGWMALTLLLRS